MRIRRYGAAGRSPHPVPVFRQVRVSKGAAKRGNKPGEDLPYFRVEWDDDLADVQAVFTELYGAEPERLSPVFVMADQPEVVFPSRMESWRSGAQGPVLVRACDGETISFLRKGQEVYRNPGLACQVECDCKQTGRLFFILPELIKRTGVLLMFRLVTHGKTDIDGILACLDFVRDTNNGVLRGVAFDLFREPVELQTPQGMRITKHVVRLAVSTAATQQLAAGYQIDALPERAGGPTPPPALPAQAQTTARRATGGTRGQSRSTGWASEQVLHEMLEGFRKVFYPDCTQEQFYAYAGLDPAALPEDWDRTFANRKAASQYILEMYEQEQDAAEAAEQEQD